MLSCFVYLADVLDGGEPDEPGRRQHPDPQRVHPEGVEGALHRPRTHSEPEAQERLGLELQPEEGRAIIGRPQQGGTYSVVVYTSS